MSLIKPTAFEVFNTQQAVNSLRSSLLTPAATLSETKQAEVEQSTAAKVETLRAIARQREIAKTSLPGKLGLDDRNAPLHTAVNAAASVVSGGARTLGDTVTAPLDVGALLGEAGVSQEAYDAYARQQSGTATAEDQTLLSQRLPLEAKSRLAQIHEQNRAKALGIEVAAPTQGASVEQRIAGANAMRETATEIDKATDLTGLVDQRNRIELSSDIAIGGTKGLDRLKSVASTWEESKLDAVVDAVVSISDLIIAGGDAVLENPAATAEYVAEMLPNIALGSLSKTALSVSNLGYGIETYRQGIQKFQAENGGKMPAESLRQHMLLNAIAAVGAEAFGDATLLRAADNVADAAKGAGVLKRTAAVIKEGVKDTLTEGVTEGFQTYAEGQASLNPATAEEILEGAVIGAAVGGTLGTSLAGAKQLAQASDVQTTQRITNAQREEAQTAAVASALETGDIAPLTDPANPETYNPGKAAHALAERFRREDLAPEAKEETRQQLTKLTETLDTDAKRQQDVIAMLDKGNVAGAKQLLAAAQETLKTAEPTSDEYKEAVDDVERYTHLSTVADGVDPATRPELIKQLKETRSHLEQARAANTDVIAQTVPVPEKVQAAVEKVTNPEPTPEREKAAEEVIDLMMSDPDLLSDNQLDQLVSDEASGLNPQQREYLQAVTDARTKLNALKSSKNVRQDILVGGEGFKGVAQYNRDIAQGLTAGNAQAVKSELSGLLTFGKTQASKAAAVAEMVPMLQQMAVEGNTKGKVWLLRDPTGNWATATTAPAGWKSRDGMPVYSSSVEGIAAASRFADNTRTETDAIRAAYVQGRKAYDLRFNQTKPVQPVPVTPTPSVEVAAVSPPVVADVAAPPEQVATVSIQEGLDAPVALQREVNPVEESTDEVPPVAATQSARAVLDNIPELSGNLKQAEFKGANLLGYFKQSGAREGAKSANPLVTVDNFLSSIADKVEGAFEFLGIKDTSEEQTTLLRGFTKLARQWNPVVKANLQLNENPEYRYVDLLRFFDGNPPENVLTAISFAAFSWVGEAANGSLFNDDATINAILLRDGNTTVTKAEQLLLQDVGVRQNLIIQDLGKRAFNAAGFKVGPDTPSNIRPQLELSLGSHALAMMLQQGLVERNEEFLDIKPDEDGELTVTERDIPAFFIRVRQPEGKPSKRVQSIVDAHKGTKGILHNLFSVENSLVAPTLEPDKVKQATTKGTRQGVPSVLRKMLNKVNGFAYQMRSDMQQIRNALSDDIVMEIAGAEHIDQRYVHARKEKSIIATNAGIALELRRLKEFEEAIEAGKPFFMSANAWSVQRVGFLQNLVNPQTSKLHRHNISMEAWRTEIKPGDTDMIDRFKLAVAQGMGIKVDKQPIAVSIAQVDALMTSDLMQDAIDGLVRAQSLPAGEKLTDSEQARIRDAVAGREKFHTLDALVNWAKYVDATVNNKPFTTDILYEVDGLTNGPALAHVLLGTINKLLGEKFGMYTAESGITNAAQWRQIPGNQDLYEDVIDGAMTLVTADKKTWDSKKTAVWHFTGDLRSNNKITSTGRNQVKQPVTSMVFGAGLGKTVRNMSLAFVELFYDKLESAANADDMDQLRETIKQANKLLKPANQLQVPESFEDAMQLELNKAQQSDFADGFKWVLGVKVQAAMQGKFETFMDARKELNTAAQRMWKSYDVVFNHMKEKRIAELMESGDLAHTEAKDGTKIPLDDLTGLELDKIREQLKHIEPIVHTPMSKMSNDLSAGIYVAKLAQTIATEEDRPYTAQPKFAVKVPTIPKNADGKTSVQTLKARAMKLTEQDPGVRLVIMLVHSLDSAIATLSYGNVQALNLHDAKAVGLKDIFTVAEQMNKATFDILTDYSLPLEISAAYQRTLEGITKLTKESPELKALLTEAMPELISEDKSIIDGLTEFGTLVGTNATTAEVTKLKFLATLAVMDQYSQEGGSYQITDADREKVAQKLKELNAAPVEEAPAPGSVEPTIRSYVSMGDTPYGKLGQPSVESDPVLVSLLEKGQVTIRSALQTVKKQIEVGNTPARMKAFHVELLRQIARTVNLDTPVNYITPDTLSPTQKTNVKTARGWYRHSKKGSSINIKSPDFAHSGITPELLMHEMTHAALYQFVEANPDHAAVKELGALLELAQEKVKTDKLPQFKEATKNIHEFIAWGMTNPGFQREVLNNLTMKSDAASRTKESGLRAFIRNLVGILFRGSSKRAQELSEAGMAVFIANTGLLFEGAQQNNPTADADVVLTMTDPLTYTSAQTLDALAQVHTGRPISTGFTAHLHTVLGDIVDTVYGPFGVLKSVAERDAAVTAEDAMLNALATGEAVYASKLMATLPVTTQEAFVLESVEVTIKAALDKSPSIQRELRRLYREVKSQLGSDPRFTPIFTAEQNADGTSDFLSRFVAAGLAYEPLHQAMQQLSPQTPVQTFQGKTLGQRLQILFNRAINTLSRFMAGTREGQQPDRQLEALARRLAQIEARKKSTVSRAAQNASDTFDRVSANLSEGTMDAIRKVAGKDFFKNNKIKVVQVASKITVATLNGRAGLIIDAMQKLRDKSLKRRQGVASALLSEIQGTKDADIPITILLREAKTSDQAAQTLADTTSKQVREEFQGPLSHEAWGALTRLFIRTDVSSLLGTYDTNQLQKLIESPVALDKAIEDAASQLTGKYAHAYRNRAQDLGMYMATQRVTDKILALNAHNIAYMFGTDHVGTVSKADAEQAMPIIDTLASLYALKYVPPVHKALALDVLATENARTDSRNGVALLLELHKSIQADARQTLFAESPIQFMKGYTKEIFNPHIQVQEADPKQGALLEKAGWVKVSDLTKDNGDARKDKYALYVLKDGGTTAFVTGAMGLAGMNSRGTEVHGGDITLQSTRAINRKIANAHKSAVDALLLPRSRNYDPTKVGGTHMVPTYNLNGEVLTYRYLMDDHTKDTLLERNNRADLVMGNMARHASSKASTISQNANVVQALHDKYKAEVAKSPESFLEFSETSKDAATREMYARIPESTRIEIRRVWGRDGMRIRADLMDISVGYRKFSAADMFRKDQQERDIVERVIVGVVSKLPGMSHSDLAALRVARLEDAMQFLVKQVKDLWVVKSLFTFLGNLKYNVGQLLAMGVSPAAIVKDHITAFVGIISYQRDERELLKAQALVKTNYQVADKPALEQRIIELQDALARNPVREVVEAGLYHTIAEDIDTDEDSQAYMGRIHRWVDQKSRQLPDPLRRIGRTLYMTHDTPLYKVMNQMTHIGDFMGRYTVYQHMINRSKNPLTRAEAIELADNAFVNYDKPTHKTIQYLNDMGILPFTKYYLRMQAVLFQLYRDNPGRTLVMAMLHNMFSWFPSVSDPFLWEWLDRNPLSTGPLNFPGALDEAITIKAISSPF